MITIDKNFAYFIFYLGNYLTNKKLVNVKKLCYFMHYVIVFF